MAKKKRKVKVFRLIIVFVLFCLIIAGLIFLIYLINNKEEKKEFNINDLHINEINYDDASTLDLDLYSNDYLLMRLNDFKVLYASNNSTKMFPASLTKVLTMDALLNNTDNINETSSFTYAQRDELISQNASLAYIDADENYTLEELLYALILPSGADAAVALDNYLNNKGTNLVYEMNKICDELSLNNSHFTNTTGLHDDDLYTTLDDYSKIVIDTLLNDEGKKVLKTTQYNLRNELILSSTLSSLADRKDIKVYGGKTGYTDIAGMNIMVLYEVNNRSYLLILGDASGNPYEDGMLNIADVNKIFDYLY